MMSVHSKNLDWHALLLSMRAVPYIGVKVLVLHLLKRWFDGCMPSPFKPMFFHAFKQHAPPSLPLAVSHPVILIALQARTEAERPDVSG